MEDKQLADFGGPKADALPIEDVTTQVSSSEYNRVCEDVAQMTHTSVRAEFTFVVGAALHPTLTNFRSHWGNSLAQQPTVTRTAAGLYTVTFPSSYTDALGHVEAVSFIGGDAAMNTVNACSAAAYEFAGPVFKIVVKDSGGTASDLTSTETVFVWAR